MRLAFRVVFPIVLLLLYTQPTSATIHTITTPGFNFSPSTLTIALGDTIDFSIASAHNVLEVSQATWNANGNTPLPGGFSLPFGGGTLILQSSGTYYYVCEPHAGGGMKGTITVMDFSIQTGSLAASSYCAGAALVVPFTATGTFNAANIFTAQLSDGAGSFAAPTAIGTLAGTGSGQINATIPAGTAAATGYRVRVVSSSPVVIGTDNGSNVTILTAPQALITPAGPTTFCEGQSVQLDATTGSGYGYEWFRNGVLITGAAAASYLATTSGQYTVSVSNGACSTLSAQLRVMVHPTDPTTLVWTGGVDSDWSTIGNWNNPCAIPTVGDTVTIGPGAPPPTTIPTITLSKLTVNNTAGVALGGDLGVSGNLTLSSGSIALGGFDLVVGPTGSITGGGAANFIVTDGSGMLRIDGIGSGGRTGAVLFPVGQTAAAYTPIAVTNIGTADAFAVRVSDGVLDGGESGAPIPTNVVGRTWHIAESSPGGSLATLQFEWSGADELPGFDRAACYIAHHDGAAWQPLQAIGPAGGGGPFQLSVSGVTSFSPFAIGDGASPLPVEYRSFTTEMLADAVRLRWETTRETNSHGFTPERRRAADAHWTALGFVGSRGSADAGAAYEYLDTPPAAGVWEYRLRQVDMDGTESSSPILQIALHGPTADGVAHGLRIDATWPNPLRKSEYSEMTIQYSGISVGPAMLTLHDFLGREVRRVHLADVRGSAGGDAARGVSGTVRIDVSALPPGVYFCRISGAATSSVQRILLLR